MLYNDLYGDDLYSKFLPVVKCYNGGRIVMEVNESKRTIPACQGSGSARALHIPLWTLAATAM